MSGKDDTLFGGDFPEIPPERSKTEQLFAYMKKQQKSLNDLKDNLDDKQKEDKIKELSGKSISIEMLLKLLGLSTVILTILGSLLWISFLEPRVASMLEKRVAPIEKTQDEHSKKIEEQGNAINALGTDVKILDFKVRQKGESSKLKASDD